MRIPVAPGFAEVGALRKLEIEGPVPKLVKGPAAKLDTSWAGGVIAPVAAAPAAPGV
jgi:hypothetical protein